MTPVLELRGVHKHFGSLHALQGADFSLERGELHALLGENGAGKSTVMNIAAGILRPDRGTILVDGQAITMGSPRAARRAGIGTVHQHFTSVPAFDVGENLALAAGWALRPADIRRKVRDLGQRLGLALDPGAIAGSLTVPQRQRLELLKALATGATILLLDEPTGSLAPDETGEFLKMVRRLVDAGGSAVLITHKLPEALLQADRVTVLRHGAVTLRGNARDLDAAEVTRAMLGRELSPPSPPGTGHPGARVVTADQLSVAPIDGRGPGLVSASFEMRGGEVTGIAAVQGNGERELTRIIAGLIQPAGGGLKINGPVAFIPEDRTEEGIIPEFTVWENMMLTLGRSAPWVKNGIVNPGLARQVTSHMMIRHGIRAEGPDTPAGSLSGGNQQKLLLARALELHPGVLVAENPARGLDVLAAQEAFERIALAARQGTGVILYLSDIDELTEHCDRVLVVTGGRVREAPAPADRQTIGRMMLSEIEKS